MVDRSESSEPLGPDLDRVFQALADGSRRRIVTMLREAGTLRVGDVAAVFDVSLNAVSKHLKVLEAAGIVTREVRGREHWLRVADGAFEEARDWLDVHRHFWGARLDALASQVESEPKDPNAGKKSDS